VVSLTDLTFSGARDETKRKLEHALAYSGNPACIHQVLKDISLTETLMSASQMFYQPGLVLRDYFVSQSEAFYQTAPMELHHSSEENIRLINGWVSNVTHHKITELVDDVSPDARIVLANAVYFQSKWITTFDSKKTSVQKFSISGNRGTVMVPMMKSKSQELVSIYDPFLQAMVGGCSRRRDICLIPFSPSHGKRTLPPGHCRVGERGERGIGEKGERNRFTICPATKVGCTNKTNKCCYRESAQQRGGLDDLFFSPNLCGISDQEELVLTDAQHRAVLEVNEEGAQGAAATIVTLARTIRLFMVEQSFLLAVWDEEGRYPVFLGRVLDPSL
uniref:Serpin domain-containing protein n=1 Tax=Latimeria chalumnae TaxID=7897 RepID=H3A3Z8_LATCH